jgi:CBS domain-containing protein
MDSSLLAPFPVGSAPSLLERIVANDDSCLQSDDSAFCALTDFRREYPITVQTSASIDDALSEMNRFGIHALLVTQDEAGVLDSQIVGLITAYDIERHRPHRSLNSRDPKPGKPARVCDVMTPWNELSLVKYESLQALTAVDVYKMFQGTGLTHLLVVELHGDDSAVLRGLLSRAALAKRLTHGHASHSR